MRICLDARKLWDSGIGTYIRGLLQGFNEIAADTSWDFLVDTEDRNSDFLKGDRHICEARHYSIGELFSISRAANRTRADLFHAPHYVMPLGLRLPAIVTVHDVIHLKFPEYFAIHQRVYARWMLKRAGRIAKIILTVSERTKLDLVELLRIPQQNIVVSYSGVGRRYFEPMADEQLAEFRKRHDLPSAYLLYVGNLKPHKNVAGLIKAWTLLADSVRAPLVIVGEKKDQYEELQHLAIMLGREKEVFFAGGRPDQEMVPLYRCAAAYVQPSWYEGFGSPPLEAMAGGVPAAVSNRGALPEIASDGALIFDPSNPDEMQAAMERLLTDACLRDELGRKGPARAAIFTWEEVAQKTLTAYQQAMAG